MPVKMTMMVVATINSTNVMPRVLLRVQPRLLRFWPPAETIGNTSPVQMSLHRDDGLRAIHGNTINALGGGKNVDRKIESAAPQIC